VLIVTDFRTSMPALDVVSTSMVSSASDSSTGLAEIDRPLFAATQVMAHPGTNPTVTVPVFGGRLPDVDRLWAFLAEPAEFFGFSMPAIDTISNGIAGFVEAAGRELLSLTVTIVDIEGAAHVVVTGNAVQFVQTGAVRIDACDAESPLTQPDHQWWLRMAARTTSRADEDQVRRWLGASGHVDAVHDGTALGAPFLGALVFVRGSDVCGFDNVEPTSILAQLQECGAIAPVRRVSECPVDAERAWWISPGYECHPVAAIGLREYAAVVGAAPPFARVP
jgi:hypothetical protein